MNTKQLFSFKMNLLIISFTALFGCNYNQMSTLIEDSTKGFNGSFEHSQQGLPVNWQLYTNQTVPSGDFDILLDSTDYKDGKQSLQFNVRNCSATGGWHSPGIAQQMNANSGEVYKVSFWTKNNGGSFISKISGINATEGDSEVIVETNEKIEEWKYYEHIYSIPTKMNAIRFEFNALHEGIFWIDDVRIEKYLK